MSPTLQQHAELINPLLNCEDDLKESARAVEGIERYLLLAARLLQKQDLTREDVMHLLSQDMDLNVDALAEALSSLRRGLMVIGERLP